MIFLKYRLENKSNSQKIFFFDGMQLSLEKGEGKEIFQSKEYIYKMVIRNFITDTVINC